MFEVAECATEGCDRKIPADERWCITHAETALAYERTLAKAVKVRKYKRKFAHLKTLEGLADLGAEVLYKLTTPGEFIEDDDGEPVQEVDEKLVRSLVSMMSLQRQLIHDVTVERKVRMIDLVLKKRLGISVKKLMEAEESARLMSVFDTANIVIDAPSETPEGEEIDPNTVPYDESLEDEDEDDD